MVFIITVSDFSHQRVMSTRVYTGMLEDPAPSVPLLCDLSGDVPVWTLEVGREPLGRMQAFMQWTCKVRWGLVARQE